MGWLDKFLKLIQVPSRSARSARVNILPTHHVCFEVFSEDKPFTLEVANISTDGVGFRKNENVHWQALGKQLTGELKIQGRAFRATVQIRHVSKHTAGSKILSGDPEIKKAIENYLLYEITGLGLKPVRKDILNKKPNEVVHWFVDAHKNELYASVVSGKIESFHMSFLGNYVSFEAGKKPRYGHVIENVAPDNFGHKSSDQVRYIDSPPPEVGRIAYRILSGVEGLDPNVKEQIEVALKPLLKHIEVND